MSRPFSILTYLLAGVIAAGCSQPSGLSYSVPGADNVSVPITLLIHQSGAHAFDLSQNPRSREIVKETAETIVRWLNKNN